MNALLQIMLPFIEGKGGGKPDRAQGGGAKQKGLAGALECLRNEVVGR